MTVQEFIEKGNFQKHMIGVEYIGSALEKYISEKKTTMEEIYESIADDYGVNKLSVEAAIRRAIYVSYDSMDKKMRKKLFPKQDVIPSNGKYIKTVGYCLKKGIL